ncbi:MAG: hypothetical protein IIC83_13975 [Chloroflexi bacterium]|nr:hypothetical protein [Chloroflexota bacterium]
MIKLAVRVVLLTIILQGAALFFAGEAILTTLILFTIALTVTAIALESRPTEDSAVEEL